MQYLRYERLKESSKLYKILEQVSDENYRRSNCIFLISDDNGKSYIILFCKINNASQYIKISLRFMEDNQYYYDDNSQNEESDLIDTNESNECEIEDVINELDQISLKSIIYEDKLSEKIYILHKHVGWQQIFNDYIYRGLDHLSRFKPITFDFLNDKNGYSSVYHFDPDLFSGKGYESAKNQFNDLLGYIKSTSLEFSIPVFSYLLFSVCKSLFKQLKSKTDIFKEEFSFALNIQGTDDYELNNVYIDYVLGLTANFFEFSNKSYKETPSHFINKEFKLNYNQFFKGYKIHIKNTKLKVKDFPVFLYESSENDSNTCLNKINQSTLKKALSSKLSFIYYNASNEPYNFINLSIPTNNDNNISTGLDIKKLIKRYLDYIAYNLSKEIHEKEKLHLHRVYDKIKSEVEKDSSFNLAYKYVNELISRFSIDECSFIEKKKVKNKKLLFFKHEVRKMIKKLTLNDFEALFSDYAFCNSDIQNKDILFNYSECCDKANWNAKYNDEDDSIYEITAKDLCSDFGNRYRELLFNKYFKIKTYKSSYMDNMFMNAYEVLSAKKYDKIQTIRCSFLYAALMSFNEFVSIQFPDLYNDFKVIFDSSEAIFYELCAISKKVVIDDIHAIKLFKNFINIKASSGEIVEHNSLIEPELGWINTKKNEIWLKNNNNFYKSFVQYLGENNFLIKHSKTTFVSNILDTNYIIYKRTAGSTERYDSTRTINKNRIQVLVLHNDALQRFE